MWDIKFHPRQIKEDLSTCIKLTYNMEKSSIYKYAGFHLAGHIYEELIYMCKEILELNGISTIYYRMTLKIV